MEFDVSQTHFAIWTSTAEEDLASWGWLLITQLKHNYCLQKSNPRNGSLIWVVSLSASPILPAAVTPGIWVEPIWMEYLIAFHLRSLIVASGLAVCYSKQNSQVEMGGTIRQYWTTPDQSGTHCLHISLPVFLSSSLPPPIFSSFLPLMLPCLFSCFSLLFFYSGQNTTRNSFLFRAVYEVFLSFSLSFFFCLYFTSCMRLFLCSFCSYFLRISLFFTPSTSRNWQFDNSRDFSRNQFLMIWNLVWYLIMPM